MEPLGSGRDEGSWSLSKHMCLGPAEGPQQPGSEGVLGLARDPQGALCLAGDPQVVWAPRRAGGGHLVPSALCVLVGFISGLFPAIPCALTTPSGGLTLRAPRARPGFWHRLPRETPHSPPGGGGGPSRSSSQGCVRARAGGSRGLTPTPRGDAHAEQPLARLAGTGTGICSLAVGYPRAE